MNLLKKSSAVLALTGALMAAAALLPHAAFAYNETSTAAINADQAQAMVKGYDVVSYFSNKAMAGDKKFSAQYMGATYYFATAANQKTFQANPAHYAPQFGGFCAMGAALGKKLDVDPTQFVVHNDKLYLNVNADVFKMFSSDINGNIKKADTNWPSIKDKAPNTL